MDSEPKTGIPFTATAEIDYGSHKFSAKLTFRNSGSASLEFLSPSEVKGLVFELDGEQIGAQYNGLSFTLPQSQSGIYSSARLLFSSLSGADGKKKTVLSNGDFEMSGSIEGIDYFLVFDKNSGNLKSLYVPSIDFKTEFKEFTYLY